MNPINKEKDKKTYNKDNYPDHIKILDKKNFNDFINNYPISIVDFWAPWCIHCKTMTPRIRRLSILYKNKIAFGKINTSKNQEISKQYKIMSIPQIIFFKNGSKKFSITGLKSIGQIKKKIDDFLKK